VDPGFRVTGFGVIDTNGQESRHVANGVINAAAESDGADRLGIIFARVGELVREYEPQEFAIERVFVAKNADSALKLGQARSAAICATFGSDIPVFEYAAREVKQAVVGKGGADKGQVQHMVRILLNLSEAERELKTDAADALGIALCHAHTRAVARQYAEVLP
jgi:crossover junction endodeoxyribonuclease RuvC